MPRILQEKFQVTVPKNTNDEESGWISDKQARAKKNMPGREGRAGGDDGSKLSDKGALFNVLPPGMDIEDQEVTDQRHFKTVMAGADDISHDNNPGALKKGFTRKKLLSTDDEYTGEHVDAFYDSITVDGDTGFVERNNMLDRL